MAQLVALPNPSDVAAFSGEWAALLEAASPARDSHRLVNLLRSADWARLLLLAEVHGVTGHVAVGVRERQEALIPLEVRQELAARQRVQSLFTLRLTAELFRILQLFASEGIGAMVVKGPVLAMRAYADPAIRIYGDLDLLVRQRDIRRATVLLVAAGFSSAISLGAVDAGKIPGQYLFSKRDSNLIVELHNDFTLRYFPRRLPLEDYFARQTAVRLDAHEVPALSVEDELVLICIHGAKHFWERLMWIADVAGLLSRQKNIDWRHVEDSAEAVGAQRMLHTGLRLSSDLLNVQLPEAIQRAVHADMPAARLSQQISQWLPAAGHAAPKLLERAMFRLRMRGGLFSAPAFLLRLAFSPTEEDWQASTQDKGHSLIEAAWRPFRLARKHGSGRKG
jgi:hypothetical protein